MFYSILLIVQVILSIALVSLVLLQHGKGADAGAAFGSGASATVFGARGSANVLSRATALTATGFFINSLALAFIVAKQPEAPSVVDLIESTPRTVQESFQFPPTGSEALPAQEVPVEEVPVEEGPADVPN